MKDRTWKAFLGPLGASLPIVGGIGVLILCVSLRGSPAIREPLLFSQLQFTSGIVALAFAGAAFIRFRGTRDRLALILAMGFILVGVTLASSSFGLASLSTAGLRDPMTWVIGRTLLAILLVAALLVQPRYARSSNPSRDLVATLFFALLLSVFLGFLHRQLPSTLVFQSGHLFPRPGNLVPAAFFLVAAFAYHRRLRHASAPFDLSLFIAVTMNFWSSIAAAQSDLGLDASFALASILQFSSYAVLLAGALFDNLHLFQYVQRMAVSDPVTGLANYRRFMESLEMEIQRTGRTGRSFALLLFDLDGLKLINDQFGHRVGTRALCRTAEVLRSQSRAIDIAARHGGDEFALVLPETSHEGAQEVLTRVCEHVASDDLQPRISVSGGIAVYPRDAQSVEALMDVADRSLYAMKKQNKRIPPIEKYTIA